MTSLYDGSQKPSRLLPILILLVAILLAGGGIWGYFSLRGQHPTLDSVTLCPTDGPRSRTVLLLDISDPLTSRQQAALDTLLSDLRNPKTSRSGMEAAGLPGATRYVEPYGELVAYSLGAEDTEQDAFLRICNPGNPDEVTFEGELTSSKRRITARWDKFEDGIKDAFNDARTSQELPNSPLLEAVALIVQKEASSKALRASGNDIPLTLILFSDMLQNSKSLSHFQELPDWNSFESDPTFLSIRADLYGVDVIIFYLQRAKYGRFQTPTHYSWWQDAVSRMNGKLIYIEPI